MGFTEKAVTSGSPDEVSCFFSSKTTEHESYFSQAGSSSLRSSDMVAFQLF